MSFVDLHTFWNGFFSLIDFTHDSTNIGVKNV